MWWWSKYVLLWKCEINPHRHKQVWVSFTQGTKSSTERGNKLTVVCRDGPSPASQCTHNIFYWRRQSAMLWGRRSAAQADTEKSSIFTYATHSKSFYVFWLGHSWGSSMTAGASAISCARVWGQDQTEDRWGGQALCWCSGGGGEWGEWLLSSDGPHFLPHMRCSDISGQLLAASIVHSVPHCEITLHLL